MWHSDLSQDVGPHGNPADEKTFVNMPPVAVSPVGTIELTLRVDELVTLTTRTTGHKGHHPSINASPAPLPLPHAQTFDDEALDKPGGYFRGGTSTPRWERGRSTQNNRKNINIIVRGGVASAKNESGA